MFYQLARNYEGRSWGSNPWPFTRTSKSAFFLRKYELLSVKIKKNVKNCSKNAGNGVSIVQSFLRAFCARHQQHPHNSFLITWTPNLKRSKVTCAVRTGHACAKIAPKEIYKRAYKGLKLCTLLLTRAQFVCLYFSFMITVNDHPKYDISA